MKSNILFMIALFLTLQAVGQNDNVTIIYTGNREVEKAYRLTNHPKIIDTVLSIPATEYPLLSLHYTAPITLDTVQPALIKIDPKLQQLYHFYAKAGIGNNIMPLGEFYYNGARSRKFNYGVHLKHLSSTGKISGYAPAQFDRNSGKLFGAINEKNYTLTGDVQYNNNGFHYYGIQDETISRDSIAQRFSDIEGNFRFASHKKDSANLNYAVGLTYSNYLSKKPLIDSLSKWRALENYVALKGEASYRLGKEIFAADLDVKYNDYRYGEADSALTLLDSGIVLNNTIISLKPSITTFAKNNRFKAKIGVDVTLDMASENQLSLFPLAEVKYSLFNDLFIPFAGARGGVHQNRFKTLSRTNEFVLPNINMQNENTSIDLYFGIKGTLSKRIGFNVNASFANVKNKALFVTDTLYSMGNQFGIIFDTLNITTLEGSISYQLNEKLKVDGIGRYYSYQLKGNTYAWNLPQFQILARGSYNLFDKFLVNLDLNFEGGRKALVYAKEENTTEENNQFAKTLGFIADVNLGLEYRYNKRISAFLQCNNFAAQGYNRWYNTPVQGFQVMGGVTFRF
ncbi:hypothetical protein N9E20_00030 [Crocinitomicaceae bacterium]|nr:hypothetical protein [Crocinitomicaceae bacterium]